MVIEIDDTGNHLHRLKIGDGEHKFSELPYLSVDNFVMSKKYYIDIKGSDNPDTEWYTDSGLTDSIDDDRHYQIVQPYYMEGEDKVDVTITPNSKIDLQLNAKQLILFHAQNLAFVVENVVEDSETEVRAYRVGQIPQDDHRIQVMITEVFDNE